MKTKAARQGWRGAAAVLVVALLALLAGSYVPHVHDDSGRVVHSHNGGGSYHAH